MRKGLRNFLLILIIATVILTGCNQSSQSSKTETSTTDTAAAIATNISTSSLVVVDTEFTASDLEVGYENSTATQITLEGNNIKVSGDGAKAEGNLLTISNEGTYVITGTLLEGQIVVDVKDTDKVQIVLNGVSITCSDNAPIYIKEADKVFITLVENTENSLADGTNYTQTDENIVDGVIFSMADLTMNGGGTLNVTGNYKHGIVSKDDLVFTGGTFNITAVKDAINGKDSVKIKEGIFVLSAENGNGIQSKNGEDTTTGYVYISGGNITIKKCVEGIEGTAIIIEDGTINLTSEDDGMNASSGDTTLGSGAFENDTDCYISISGGTITINAAGDGIDSNGSLYVTGGTTYVSGPTENMNGSIDYNGSADITGGTIVVAGSAGMAQGFSDTSSQYSLLYNLTTVCAAGTEVKLTDSEGKVVASYTPNKEYQSVIISTPELAKDAAYTLTCGDQTADITLSGVVTSNGQQAGMGGQGFPGGRGNKGEKPSFDGMERPSDGTVPGGTPPEGFNTESNIASETTN